MMTCLVAYGIYQHSRQSGSSRDLHPTPLRIASRPPFAQSDLVQLFPEQGAAQVAILLTQSDENGESPMRCLQAMGIPFFVTRDLRTALHHRLVILYPAVEGTTYRFSLKQR